MKKTVMLLILGSVILLVISLSGCFLIQNSSSNVSYFPEKTGEAQVAIYPEGSSVQGVTNVNFSNENFNGHSDFAINFDVTEQGAEVKENIFFWKNSSGELYLDGAKMHEDYNGSTYQDTAIINGLRLIDNADTGENQSPVNLSISGYDDSGNFSPETLLRTSETISSLTVQGKSYQNVLKVKFSDPTNSENYAEVYFAKGIGIVRAIISSYNGSQNIVIDFFNFQNGSSSIASQKNPEKRVKINNGVPFFFPFFNIKK